MIEQLNLSILKKIPEPNLEAILEIEPLAPLSMVSELPGSYYKTLKSPDKKMICGLFENVLGWHIDLSDRKSILKEIIKIRKKQKLEYSDGIKGSTYTPLLMEYFEINLKYIPSPLYYDDLWSKAFRRGDADVHPKGSSNLDYKLIPLKRDLKRDDKKPKQIDNKDLFDFFKDNLQQFPLYYSTPTSREYIYLNGKYEYKLIIDHELYDLIQEKIECENIGYLGTSEGWVNIKLRKL